MCYLGPRQRCARFLGEASAADLFRGASGPPEVLASLVAAAQREERFAAPAARFGGELAEARRLVGDGRYSSIARLRVIDSWGVREIRALVEATYFAGLRKAGMPEE